MCGEKAAVQRAAERCVALGAKRAMPLPVSAVKFQPDERGREAARLPAKVAIAALKLRLVNNVGVKVETAPEAIRDALVRQGFAIAGVERSARCARRA